MATKKHGIPFHPNVAIANVVSLFAFKCDIQKSILPLKAIDREQS